MRFIALIGQKQSFELKSGNAACNCPAGKYCRHECETQNRTCDLYEEPDYINVYSHRRTYSEPELFVAVIGEYKNKSTSSEHLNRTQSLPPKKKKKRVHW